MLILRVVEFKVGKSVLQDFSSVLWCWGFDSEGEPVTYRFIIHSGSYCVPSPSLRTEELSWILLLYSCGSPLYCKHALICVRLCVRLSVSVLPGRVSCLPNRQMNHQSNPCSCHWVAQCWFEGRLQELFIKSERNKCHHGVFLSKSDHTWNQRQQWLQYTVYSEQGIICSLTKMLTSLCSQSHPFLPLRAISFQKRNLKPQ